MNHKYSIEEIELTFKMYPIAKQKIQFNHYQAILCEEEVVYYTYITNQVSIWLDFLNYEEQKIIDNRCFQGKTFKQIAFRFHYADHSVVLRRYRSILNKVQISDDFIIYI